MKNITLSILFALSQVILMAQCPPGDLMFSSQAQIDEFKVAYPNCTELEGGIILTGSGIMNLYGLSNLTSIGGDLNVLYCATLQNLMGLEGLESIGGTLMINENYIFTSLVGLNNLTSIGANLIVYLNANMNSTNGLNSLASIAANLIISENAITTITGLNNLNSVGNTLEIDHNPLLTSIAGLENLNSVGGDFWINTNEVLASLDGLENLTTIGGELSIQSNYQLSNIEGLTGLSSIGGQLAVQSNYALTSLTGLDNVNAASIGDLKLLSNTSLSTCEVLSICEYLGSPGKNIVISNNATGCANQQEVEDACEWVSVDEVLPNNMMSIYPNPASLSITIELPILPSHNIYMTISNTSGQQFISQSISEPKTELDISNLPAGIYFVKIWDDGEMMVKKVIKE